MHFHLCVYERERERGGGGKRESEDTVKLKQGTHIQDWYIYNSYKFNSFVLCREDVFLEFSMQ